MTGSKKSEEAVARWPETFGRKGDRKVSISKQTAMLNICRTSAYERPHKKVSDETIELMRLIDWHHTDEPTWGYRMITSHLRDRHGMRINRKRIQRPMRG